MTQDLLKTQPQPRRKAKALSLSVVFGGLLIALLTIGSDGDRLSPFTTMAQAAEPAVASAASKSASAAPKAVDAFSPAQQAQIKQMIQRYLMENPEILMEMQAALQAKSEALAAARAKLAIKRNAKDLFHRPNAAVAGNPNGDVTVVEFFDYNCGYCKRAFGGIAKLVELDPKVRVVFKELPILGSGSVEAATVALAARMQGKYWEMHRALLSSRGRANKKTALKLAAKIGLDIEKLKRDMASKEVKEEISETLRLAEKMGIRGTPHFVVGENVIPGAPDNLREVLSGHIADIRKYGCTIC